MNAKREGVGCKVEEEEKKRRKGKVMMSDGKRTTTKADYEGVVSCI